MRKTGIRKIIDKAHAQWLMNRANHIRNGESPDRLPESVGILRRATRLGSVKAALALADIYMDESNPDTCQPEKGQRLLTRLADRGNAEACYKLGRLLDDSRASKYLVEAVKKEYAPAQVFFGELLLLEDATQEEIQTGVRLLSHAAESGNIEAQVALAKAFYTGATLPGNPKRALYWATKAALSGDVSAQKLVAVIHDDKSSPDCDVRESFFWMHQAAKQRDAYAQGYVGECLQEGRGIRQNTVKAVEFYQKAADQGDGFATTRLGLCHIFGRGVKEDSLKGIALLKAAAEGGYEFASIHLARLVQNHIIDLSQSEAEQYEALIKATDLDSRLSEEPVPTGRRRKNWVQAEFRSAAFMQSAFENSEIVEEEEMDDDPLPTPFDPLLKLGRWLAAPFVRHHSKSGKS